MTSNDPLPPHLDRIGRQLTAAAYTLVSSDEAPSTPSRRRRIVRIGTATGAASLAAVAGLLVLDQRSGESPWAKATIQRAADVVIPPASPDTILHFAATETLSPLAQRASDTTVSTVTVQEWIQQGSPWGERTIEQTPGGPVLERDSSGEIYNQTSNTVYPGPQLPTGKPQYTLTPLGGGEYRLSAPLPGGGISTPATLDASTVRAVRDGTDDVTWAVSWNGHSQQVGPMALPSASQLAQTQAQQPSPESTGFAAELRSLLDSGHARVTRTTTDDGQPAIEIASVNPQSGPQTDYYVNPQTYAPVELDIFGSDSPDDVTRVHFTEYGTLPLAGNQQLLRIAVPATASSDQHPGDYWRAADLPPIF